MRAVTGQRNPAAPSSLGNLFGCAPMRLPSGSPKLMRLPSACRITPGSIISVEKYASDPTTRRCSMSDAIDSPGVNAFETQSFQLAADALEIPPRNAVLRRHDHRVSVRTRAVVEEREPSGCALLRQGTRRRHPGCQLRSPVTSGRTSKSSVRAHHPESAFSHCLQMGTAGKQYYVARPLCASRAPI